MIVLVGESCSGKTTLAEYITGKTNFEKLVTCTTRPIRQNEKDGVDYIFLSDEKFQEIERKNGFFETAKYNNWHYGTPKTPILANKIAVLSPPGLRKLKQRTDISEPIISIYLYVSRRSRLINALRRGDDIEEAYRRNLSDVGMFDGIENEVDIVIKNDWYEKSCEQLFDELKTRGIDFEYHGKN